MHYWATAEDNKEPRPNHSETRAADDPASSALGRAASKIRRTSRNGADGQQQQNEDKPGQGGERSKAEKGRAIRRARRTDRRRRTRFRREVRPGAAREASRRIRSTATARTRPSRTKRRAGQEQASSDPSKRPEERRTEFGRGRRSAQQRSSIPKHSKPMRSRRSLKDKEKQEREQQDKPEQPSSDQKQDAGQSGGQQQGSPQQGDQQQDDGQKQNGDQGNQQPQGNSGEKKDQGGIWQSATQGSNPQSKLASRTPHRTTPATKAGRSAESHGQGNQKSSPSSRAIPAARPTADSQTSGRQGLRQPARSAVRNRTAAVRTTSRNLRPAEGQDQNAGGQSKPDSKQAGGEKGQQNQSAGGEPKSEKPQPGGETGQGRIGQGRQSAELREAKPGGQGPGDENQVAQGGPKPDEKKPSGSGGSDSQNLPGSEKSRRTSPKTRAAIPRAAVKVRNPSRKRSQRRRWQSGGGEKPKPGQGDQTKAPAAAARSPMATSPASNKGGTADGEPRQQDPGKSGEPTQQDSSGAPDSQVDREHGEQKTGDAQEGLNPKSDNRPVARQQPARFELHQRDQGRSQRRRRGGRRSSRTRRPARAPPARRQPADNGGSVSDEHGDGATGKKAGEDVPLHRAHRFAAQGAGQGQRREAGTGRRSNGQGRLAKAARRFHAELHRKPGQVQRRPGGRSVFPAGGPPRFRTSCRRQPGERCRHPRPQRPSRPRANPTRPISSSPRSRSIWPWSISRTRRPSRSPELLDRLGWTKEEAQKFLENMQKLKDSAQQPGSEGEAAKKAYNEFLKNLDLHPHGTQISGGTNEDRRPAKRPRQRSDGAARRLGRSLPRLFAFHGGTRSRFVERNLLRCDGFCRTKIIPLIPCFPKTE